MVERHDHSVGRVSQYFLRARSRVSQWRARGSGNLGTTKHSHVQGLLHAYFLRRRKAWGVTPLIEVRTRLAPNRYRIPDLCIVRGPLPDAAVLSSPPWIWIEILSPEDRRFGWSRKSARSLILAASGSGSSTRKLWRAGSTRTTRTTLPPMAFFASLAQKLAVASEWPRGRLGLPARHAQIAAGQQVRHGEDQHNRQPQ